VRAATQPSPTARVPDTAWNLVESRATIRWLSVPVAAAVFVACLAVYIAGRSPSLDDWDSINFVKAVVRFSVADQAPHPPGYPAYIFLARIVNLFLHDPAASLTLLSAITGAAGVAFLWLLAADVGVPWLALPLAPMPLYWLNSDMALSDVPGLAFAIAAVWLLHRGAQPGRTGYLLAGCATTGLCAGVRPQVAIVPLAVLVLYTAPAIVRAVGWRPLLTGSSAFIGACLTWAIPFATSLAATPEPLAPFGAQARYVQMADSLLGKTLTWSRIEERLADFGAILSRYLGGPADGGIVSFWVLTVIVVVLTAVSWRAPLTRLALAWMVAYGALMIAVMQPGDPRKALPIVPPLLLLLGSALASRSGLRRGIVPVGLVLTLWFRANGTPLIRELVQVPAPPEQAAVYIAQHFSSDDTFILSDTSANHMQYRLPQFASYGLDFISDVELNQELARHAYRRVIILDRWQRPGMPVQFQPVEVELFQRDPMVLPKAARVAFTSWEYLP